MTVWSSEKPRLRQPPAGRSPGSTRATSSRSTSIAARSISKSTRRRSRCASGHRGSLARAASTAGSACTNAWSRLYIKERSSNPETTTADLLESGDELLESRIVAQAVVVGIVPHPIAFPPATREQALDELERAFFVACQRLETGGIHDRGRHGRTIRRARLSTGTPACRATTSAAGDRSGQAVRRGAIKNEPADRQVADRCWRRDKLDRPGIGAGRAGRSAVIFHRTCARAGAGVDVLQSTPSAFSQLASTCDRARRVRFAWNSIRLPHEGVDHLYPHHIPRPPGKTY